MNKEEFLQSMFKSQVLEVSLPERDGESVYIREITVAEREQIEAMAARVNKSADTKTFRQKCAVVFLSDENGERWFNDTEFARLDSMSALVIEAICAAGFRFNRMEEEESKEREKN